MGFEFKLGTIQKKDKDTIYWNITFGRGENKCPNVITLKNQEDYLFNQDDVIKECLIQIGYSPKKLEENEWIAMVNNAIYVYNRKC